MNLNAKTGVVTGLGILLCLCQPTLAQIATNAIGAIDATIDGAPYSAETLEVPSEGTATAEVRTFGPTMTVSIQGHDPAAESRMQNVLSIEFTLMGEGASAAIMDPEVSYWPDGMNAPFFITENSGTPTEVALETLSLGDGASQARGSFSALMCRKDDFFSDSDPNDCLPVEGTFDTALSNAE